MSSSREFYENPNGSDMNLLKCIPMKFNQVDVGHIEVYDDGTLIPEFRECAEANDCIYFLVMYALRHMLQSNNPRYDEMLINLN